MQNVVSTYFRILLIYAGPGLCVSPAQVYGIFTLPSESKDHLGNPLDVFTLVYYVLRTSFRQEAHGLQSNRLCPSEAVPCQSSVRLGSAGQGGPNLTRVKHKQKEVGAVRSLYELCRHPYLTYHIAESPS